jgi:anaerobic sulfite reductase subunit B
VAAAQSIRSESAGTADAARYSTVPSSFQVAGRRHELADTWTLELEPTDDDGGLGEFRPGQFAMLYAFGAGEVPISVSGGVGGRKLVHTVRAVGAATRAICACEPGRLGRGSGAVRQRMAAGRGRGR